MTWRTTNDDPCGLQASVPMTNTGFEQIGRIMTGICGRKMRKQKASIRLQQLRHVLVSKPAQFFEHCVQHGGLVVSDS